MLPKSQETERGLYLHDVIQKSSSAAFVSWPMPTPDDYALIGELIVLYSYIDLSLRRIIEVWDHAGMLPAVWKGKSANLTMADVETVIRAMPDWAESNSYALGKIEAHRGLRNLVAHFAVRRFPDDDAFLFVTKSRKDFVREFKREPNPGMVMTGVVEVSQIRAVLVEVRGLQKWLYKVTGQIETLYFKSKANVAV